MKEVPGESMADAELYVSSYAGNSTPFPHLILPEHQGQAPTLILQ